MTRDKFVHVFGGMYEHSPWAAERAWRPRLEKRQSIIAMMKTVVDHADLEQQDVLIKAHPDLAGKLALSGALTRSSSQEQAGAGLDRCSQDELDKFQSNNGAYKEQFGFPFIIAVKGKTRQDILQQFEVRLNNDRTTERATALTEIHKIARLRIEATFDEIS